MEGPVATVTVAAEVCRAPATRAPLLGFRTQDASPGLRQTRGPQTPRFKGEVHGGTGLAQSCRANPRPLLWAFVSPSEWEIISTTLHVRV